MVGGRVEKCGAAACGECGVRALFEKVRPHEKKCGECGENHPESDIILRNLDVFVSTKTFLKIDS